MKDSYTEQTIFDKNDFVFWKINTIKLAKTKIPPNTSLKINVIKDRLFPKILFFISVKIQKFDGSFFL